MSDLISRQDAIDAVHYYIESGYKCDIFQELKDLPTAEPERKIIHCKDCKFYTPMNRKLKTGICAMTMHHLGDDGFCSDAEKKGDK